MNRLRVTALCFRLLAVVQLLTGALAFAPLAWLASWHRWLGLHAMPDDAVLRYALRGGAFVQGAIGVLLWIIASDLVRYRPLAIAVGAIYFVSGPAFYLIDTVVGMPSFWCLIDGASCFTTGSVLLALCFSARERSAAAKAR